MNFIEGMLKLRAVPAADLLLEAAVEAAVTFISIFAVSGVVSTFLNVAVSSSLVIVTGFLSKIITCF